MVRGDLVAAVKQDSAENPAAGSETAETTMASSLRRARLGVASLLLAGGGALLIPSSASAHQNTLSCLSPGVWQIVNGYGEPEHFTTDQGHAGTIPASGSVTVTYSGDSLTVNGEWENGAMNQVTSTDVCSVNETTTTAPQTTTSTTTTTVPETTTTVPETTVPETTVPGTTVPGTTVPETTVPETSTTTSPARTIEFVALGPVCNEDTPYIVYDISGNFDMAGETATLTFYDVNGNVVDVMTGLPLSGQVVYPGASVDPLDWPGWMLNDAGLWVPDPSDDVLRDGLRIVAEVNPTVEGIVSYPDATAACNSPEGSPPVPSGTLPETGVSSALGATIGSILVLLGGAMLFMSRRQSSVAD
jgi:LPXTG-motif cell wall-anchored protein